MAELASLTLYVIRHGECEHNVAGIAASQNDTPLTEHGREQARRSGRLLCKSGPDRLADMPFIASPLHRTCVTAELVREAAGLQPNRYSTDRRLMDTDWGDFTNRLVREIEDDPGYLNDPWNYLCPGGETLADVHARVGKFLRTLERDSVLVTHRDPAWMIRGHYLSLTPQEILGFHVPNACIMSLSNGNVSMLRA